MTERPTARPRSAVLTPPPGTLQVGQSVVFEAEASDPDQEEVTISYRVGGELVSTGRTFRFEASQPGSVLIEIVAATSGARPTRPPAACA